MSNSVPQHPDPDIRSLIGACSVHMRSPNPNATRAAFMRAEQGESGAPTAGQLQDVYDTACRLCDADNFRFAAPLALHLVTYQPTDPRFSFLAGTCLQRLGIFSNAAQMFCFTLVNCGEDAATVYRLGECLLALGDKESAASALEIAFDLSRNSHDSSELQSLSELLINTAKDGTIRPAAQEQQP
jgi:predicted Zn-dependent protease